MLNLAGAGLGEVAAVVPQGPGQGDALAAGRGLGGQAVVPLAQFAADRLGLITDPDDSLRTDLFRRPLERRGQIGLF